MMATGPEMRASDGDRDKVASVLREHYAQGRLTGEEFDQRLEQLYTSKTYGELATLTSDLPDVDLRELPRASTRRPERREGRDVRRAQSKGLAAAWSAWAVASSVNWVIWFIIGATDGLHFPYPWPLWVMGPWGAVLLVTTLSTGLGNRGNR
ncbi:hypothetical protein FHR32_003913 [Streptosporangium album]|uniref:DUF1707 domain-containing protein n=1 Tax=Streptosporangium album TaxID=47479 RepID=A0A7W7RXY3_9ACTN|nr:DUF1707 domain-containing protein [Streptosporangium album]MBB4939608.1 hypothetical protein [Streptosporangium album]